MLDKSISFANKTWAINLSVVLKFRNHFNNSPLPLSTTSQHYTLTTATTTATTESEVSICEASFELDSFFLYRKNLKLYSISQMLLLL